MVEYRDRFLSLARYAPDEINTEAKKKERFLNGLHDEMQTVLVNIRFEDLEELVDSAIQMEGKINQANDNRKHRMMQRLDPVVTRSTVLTPHQDMDQGTTDPQCLAQATPTVAEAM